jgi:pimeloyl-ACP methyl ester carboxylesterase
MQPSTPDAEFADVPTLATEAGVPDALRASRAEARLPSGMAVSAVRWAPEQEPAAPPRAVYLHGVGTEARTWDATVLGVGEPAIALDLPGHGRSSWRDDAVYSADTVAPTIAEALDALGVPPGILVGHSLGAIIAARVATLAPERVTGLVLVDMSPDFVQRAVDRIVRALENEGVLGDVDEIADRHFADRVGDDRAALRREALHGTVVRHDGVLVRRHHFPHLDEGQSADVGQFIEAWPDLDAAHARGLPILLVRGEKGYVTPKNVTAFGERLRDARVVTVPGRHAVQTDSPAAVADAIRTWLADVDASERHTGSAAR